MRKRGERVSSRWIGMCSLRISMLTETNAFSIAKFILLYIIEYFR